MFETKIKEIIAEQLDMNIEDIREEDDILDDLGATSLDVIEMVIAIEETFGITVEDSQIIENRCVGDVCSMIKAVM